MNDAVVAQSRAWAMAAISISKTLSVMVFGVTHLCDGKRHSLECFLSPAHNAVAKISHLQFHSVRWRNATGARIDRPSSSTLLDLEMKSVLLAAKPSGRSSTAKEVLARLKKKVKSVPIFRAHATALRHTVRARRTFHV